MSARPKAKVKEKVRTAVRDGPRAAENIGTKAAAEKIMGKEAKDGEAKVGKGDGGKGGKSGFIKGKR